MSTIAILGFFSLILVFFYLGKDDFGLKSTVKENEINEVDGSKNIDIELEEIKN